MTETYFLGANTPEGFRSEYASLQSDPRIRRLLIVKGGSGCGKSTLMKTLAARAEEYGWGWSESSALRIRILWTVW